MAAIGCSSMAIIVNEAAGEILEGRVHLTHLPPFLAALVFFVITKRIALRTGIDFVEQTLEKYLNKVGNQLRQAELMQIENLDKGEIYVKMTMDTKKISRTAAAGINVIQSVFTILFVVAYIFVTSPLSGFIFLGLFMISLLYYQSYRHSLHEAIHGAVSKETELFDDFGHVLDGFKELKISHEKNEDFFHNYLRPLSDTVKRLRIRVGDKYARVNVFSFVFMFYLSLGCVVFLLPSYVPVSVRFKVIAASAFLWDPINILSVSMPEILQAYVSGERLDQLEQQLQVSSDLGEFAASTRPEDPLYDFNEIRIENLRFDYTDKEGNTTFFIGPLNLTLKAGEILFLKGGNGSGKSTLLKMLTGLYPPRSGAFVMDGTEINMAEHRHLFSVVYTDCHLFDGLYGIESPSDEKVNELLNMMGIFHKVRWQEGQFRYSELSTGQRKRLSFITALLEDKPIYVFDEWAAEQDPEFRKSFYEKLLPELKARGKTIIAATHDEHYFHVADQVIKMEYGQVRSDA
ncbi:ATP-binding cassette domain-containing protein [Desulfonema magnum]|nr:ATP-binding cassette domain-containing protein [Desulfonema magnum]